MQSTPSEASRAGARTDPPAHPALDSVDDTTLPSRPSGSTPTLVLRSRPVLWLVAPGLLVLALALVALGRLWGVVLVPIAALFTPIWWIRVEANEQTIRRRAATGRWTEVSMEPVDSMRLRRIPFLALRWLRRGYRFGRFWTVPLTLRVQHGDVVLLQVRCFMWGGWRDLARFVASQPDIDLDERTRGRLDRYVGPVALAASAQP